MFESCELAKLQVLVIFWEWIIIKLYLRYKNTKIHQWSLERTIQDSTNTFNLIPESWNCIPTLFVKNNKSNGNLKLLARIFSQNCCISLQWEKDELWQLGNKILVLLLLLLLLRQIYITYFPATVDIQPQMFKIISMKEIQMKYSIIYICSQCTYYIIMRYTMNMQVMIW
jgi:hypothetical protein